MKARRWIVGEQQYKDIEIPDGCSVFEEDMDKKVVCPWCGLEFPFGDMYTSRLIQIAKSGFGYMVCEDCYQAEWQIEFKAKKRLWG